MKSHYTELTDKKAYVENVVRAEEESFERTIRFGLKQLDELLKDLPKGSIIDGEVIFKLYDTYGFPVELLQDMAGSTGYALDIAGFEKQMAIQQERAKKAGLGLSGQKISNELMRLGAAMKSDFLGHDTLEVKSEIVAIESGLVLKSTPFYPEGGGQISDTGKIIGANGSMTVENVFRTGDIIVHSGSTAGSFNVGEIVTAVVDKKRRYDTAKNHTATHLLHAALRKVLGEHIRQAGSYLSSNGLRFDFTHQKPLTKRELDEIAEIVNAEIYGALPVESTVMSHTDALKSGAVALFGEKYGDKVRVVTVENFSKELCGGTHVKNTLEIGAFVITSTGGVAAGIRRIEALTGLSAINYFQRNLLLVNRLGELLKSNPDELISKVEVLQDDMKKQAIEIKASRQRELETEMKKQLAFAKVVDEVTRVAIVFRDDELDMDSLRQLAATAQSWLKNRTMILILSVFGDKITLVCSVSKDTASDFGANDVIRALAPVVAGRGGGSAVLAQAGGKRPEGLEEAIERFYSWQKS
jgi:alanyl-tRNA synthetase